MRNIAVITGTRSEYGLLKNVIRSIDENKKLNLQLIVTGSHLSNIYGFTIDEIKRDNFPICAQIPIIKDKLQKKSICNESSVLMIELSKTFERINPDIVLILGDRYEIFIAATVAMMMNIPIAHISGGEVTEGAIDEQIRHAITKMAHIHFPGAKEYADNIRHMGEEEWRIFNVGDPAIENIKSMNLLSSSELSKRLNTEIDNNTMLATFHPVTLELEDTQRYINNLLNAIKKIKKKVIFTYPNSDPGSEIIISTLKKMQSQCENIKLFKNLGSLMYLSLMKNCSVVIGNSSSGIIEAPFFKKPVVNIGNRQKGRMMSKNIINCGYEEKEIYDAICMAISKEFIDFAENNTVSLYGDGKTSENITNVLENISIDKRLIKKKLTWK